MDITKMTRKQFEALPHRKWDENIIFDSLIILPRRSLHDSGFRNLDFVAVKESEPICLLSGCSDVIHVDGIGGTGQWKGYVVDTIKSSMWSIVILYCPSRSTNRTPNFLPLFIASSATMCSITVLSFPPLKLT
jgi:hypothetical protein